jgi:hypothetical protein
MFHEVHWKVDKVGQVQAVQPDDGRVVASLFVGALLAMIVPVPGRRDDHVTRAHRHSPAVDGGEPALALDDEAAGEGGMPVGGGRLTRLDQL